MSTPTVRGILRHHVSLQSSFRALSVAVTSSVPSPRKSERQRQSQGLGFPLFVFVCSHIVSLAAFSLLMTGTDGCQTRAKGDGWQTQKKGKAGYPGRCVQKRSWQMQSPSTAARNERTSDSRQMECHTGENQRKAFSIQ